MADNRTSEACLALDESMLEATRHRRSAGESLGVLARELGLSWQRLWGILRGRAPASKCVESERSDGMRYATDVFACR